MSAMTKSKSGSSLVGWRHGAKSLGLHRRATRRTYVTVQKNIPGLCSPFSAGKTSHAGALRKGRLLREAKSALLAASAQNRCTSLVCSCYAPSRSLGGNGDARSRGNSAKKSSPVAQRDGVAEELRGNEIGARVKRHGGPCHAHGGDPIHKSSLKKDTEPNEHRRRTECRKVNWPDAHGKDIADVHEFEPSVSEDGEIGGVRNSCVCSVQ